jgi:hypothetical protein
MSSAEPDVVPITIRRLKPGSYDDWRKASYDPSDPDALWADQESKAYILRSLEDPDVVVPFGFLHGHLDDLMRTRKDPEVERKMRIRVEAMGRLTEEVMSDDIYEVVEVVRKEATG